MTETAPTNDALARAIPAAVIGSRTEESGLQRTARSGWTTVAAALTELAHLAMLIAIGDVLVAMANPLPDIEPFIDHGLGLYTLVGILIGVQYLATGIEFLARYRLPSHERRGFVVPLVLLPGGRSLRSAVVGGFTQLVLIPKLVVYFVALTVGLPLLVLLGRSGTRSPAVILDSFDVIFEPLEMATNHLYNALYWNKIEPRGSAFTTFFNMPLTMWCVNH